MPTGPNGEKRSTSEISNAVWVATVATRQVEEVYVDHEDQLSGTKAAATRRPRIDEESEEE